MLKEVLSLATSVIILLGFSSFFSAAETGLLSLSASKVSRMRRGSRLEQTICLLLNNTPKLLSVILVGNLFVNVLLTTYCGTIIGYICFGNQSFKGLFDGVLIPLLGMMGIVFDPATTKTIASAFSQIFNILIVTPLLILLGELTPKTIAVSNNEAMSHIAAWPLYYLTKLLTPIVWILQFICNGIQRLIGIRPSEESVGALTLSEVNALIKDNIQSSDEYRTEMELLQRVIRFDSLTAADAMQPIADTLYVEDSCTIEKAFELLVHSKQKYLPVYSCLSESITHAIALTDYALWLKHFPQDTIASARSKMQSNSSLPNLLYPAKIITSDVPMEWILSTLRDVPWKIALVQDAKGSTVGVLTLSMILKTMYPQEIRK